MNVEKHLWDFFKVNGLSDAGVAGLLGNLWAESGLNPKNLQNTFNKALNMTDEEYTSRGMYALLNEDLEQVAKFTVEDI